MQYLDVPNISSTVISLYLITTINFWLHRYLLRLWLVEIVDERSGNALASSLGVDRRILPIQLMLLGAFLKQN